MAHIYRIGDRVRLARPNCPENYGKTGVITDFEAVPIGTECLDGYTSHECNCVVQWDNEFGASWEHTDKLEPISRHDDKQQSDDIPADTGDIVSRELQRIAGETVREGV